MPKLDGRSNAIAFFLAFLSRHQFQAAEGALPTDASLPSYLEVAKCFIRSVDFTQAQSESGIRAMMLTRSYITPYEVTRNDLANLRTAVSPEVLAQFLSRIATAGTEAEELHEQVVAKLIDTAPRLTSTELHHLWVPFLHSLLAILASEPADVLARPCYRTMFSTLLKTYLKIYVRRPPVKDTSLVRPTVSCYCGDCRELNDFLSSATRTTGVFALNQKRRRHLHSGLDSARVDCTHETRRQGSPYQLIVTKTFKTHEQTRRAWETRRSQATQLLAGFDQVKLRVVFGADYDAIVGMKQLLITPRPPPAQIQATAAAVAPSPLRVALAPLQSGINRPRAVAVGVPGKPAPTQIAGTKRKEPSGGMIEVIDLTSD